MNSQLRTKDYFTSCLYVVFYFLLSSCSNEFLKQETFTSEQINDTIYFSDQISVVSSTFNYPRGNNAKWRVLQLPAWMKVIPMEGHFENGKSSFQLEQDPNTASIPYGISQLPLVFEVEGVGLVDYPLFYIKAGNPVVAASSAILNLRNETKGSFSITNNGGGYYVWNVIDKPSWLTFSKNQGVLEMFRSELFELNITRDGLEKGEHTGIIRIAGNSLNAPIIEIKVTIQVVFQVIAGISYTIEGEVIDAEFCKNNGLLVIATKNPNRLYFSNQGKPVTIMNLNTIPVCLTISETGDFVAMVSSNADLNLINPETQSITKIIPTGIVASDIALGNNDWAYITPKQDNSYYLRSINLKTGQGLTGKAWVRGISYLKKVPGKNVLLGTRVGWSPDGLMVLDISKGLPRDTINEYHMDTWKFWLSENGDRMFCGTRKIYASPKFIDTLIFISTERPASKGELEEESHSISAIEHCAASNELFVVTKMWNTYDYPESVKVDVYDATGIFRKRTFMPAYVIIPGTPTVIPTYDVPFLFTDKQGSNLFLIKRAIRQDQNYWYLETITLK
jgi:hypothetical protein